MLAQIAKIEAMNNSSPTSNPVFNDEWTNIEVKEVKSKPAPAPVADAEADENAAGDAPRRTRIQRKVVYKEVSQSEGFKTASAATTEQLKVAKVVFKGLEASW